MLSCLFTLFDASNDVDHVEKPSQMILSRFHLPLSISIVDIGEI
jgi:hypothetical protein